jgi:ribonuclease I
MGFTLNVDHWDWVNPETQKVVRLRRGDEVPSEVLDQEGIDVKELSSSWNPVFLSAQDSPAEGQAQQESARTSGEGAGVRSQSPKVAESDKK